jgi:hypothetical protein
MYVSVFYTFRLVIPSTYQSLLPETLVTNYQSMLHNIPEQRRSHVRCDFACCSEVCPVAKKFIKTVFQGIVLSVCLVITN